MPQRASRRTAKFNRELALALRCCCDSFHCGGNADLVSLGNVDWAAFLQLVGFHRIEGIVWNALQPVRKELPDGVAAALSAASSEIAARNLVAAAASRQILQSFETAGIPVLFLKGLSVGALAYGKSSIKSAIDVDILVGPSDLAKAAELVRENHFQLTAPGDQPNSTALEDWHQSWKESVWMTESPSVQLDLHTRLADNPRLLPRMDVHSPRQLVDVGNGISLPTLATAELFAYLAVHGASSAWFRLKWISDFAGFLDRSARGSVAHLYRRSQELGAGRAAGQALLLADELFGSLGDEPALANELRRDRTAVRLFHTALRLVAGEPLEPVERRWGTWAIHRSQFGLMPGIRYKSTELAGQARRRLTRVR